MRILFRKYFTANIQNGKISDIFKEQKLSNPYGHVSPGNDMFWLSAGPCIRTGQALAHVPEPLDDCFNRRHLSRVKPGTCANELWLLLCEQLIEDRLPVFCCGRTSRHDMVFLVTCSHIICFTEWRLKDRQIIKGRVRTGTKVSWLKIQWFQPTNISWEVFFSLQVCLSQSDWSLKEVLLVHVNKTATTITIGTSFSLHPSPTLSLYWFHSHTSLRSKTASLYSSYSFSILLEEMRIFLSPNNFKLKSWVWLLQARVRFVPPSSWKITNARVMGCTGWVRQGLGHMPRLRALLKLHDWDQGLGICDVFNRRNANDLENVRTVYICYMNVNNIVIKYGSDEWLKSQSVLQIIGKKSREGKCYFTLTKWKCW